MCIEILRDLIKIDFLKLKEIYYFKIIRRDFLKLKKSQSVPGRKFVKNIFNFRTDWNLFRNKFVENSHDAQNTYFFFRSAQYYLLVHFLT